MADENEVKGGQTPADDSGGSDFAPDSRRDNPEVNRAALEAKVSKGLARLRGELPEEPEAAADESEVEEAADDQPEVVTPTDEEEDPKPSLPGGEDDEDEEEEPEEVAEEQSPKPKAKAEAKGPTFPAAIKRSLLAYGWTEDEVNEAIANDEGGKFLATATRIHQNRNQEIAAWAAAGRAARPKQEAPAEKGKPQASPHVDDKGLLKPLDVDGLIEKHGNEDFVREVTGPVNEMIARINTLLPELASGVQSIQQSKQDALARQIDQFFGSNELKPYAELYGTDSANLEDSQLETRNKVLELADALIYGAAQQGRTLTAAEAMSLAHDSVSSGHKTQAVRKEMKTKVQARGKGITLRPSKIAGAAAKNSGKPKTRAQLEAATRQRLASVFGS